MTGIGQRIKVARIKLGISQLELANRLGLTSKSTICKIERGDDNLTAETVKKYAKVLNVSVSYLMGREDINPVEIEVQNENPDVQHAMDLYEQYVNASPDIRSAIETLLKSTQSKK